MLVVEAEDGYRVVREGKVDQIGQGYYSRTVFRLGQHVFIDDSGSQFRALEFEGEKLVPLFYKEHGLAVVVVTPIEEDFPRAEVVPLERSNSKGGNIGAIFIPNIIDPNFLNKGHHHIQQSVIDVNLSYVGILLQIVRNVDCAVH